MSRMRGSITADLKDIKSIIMEYYEQLSKINLTIKKKMDKVLWKKESLTKIDTKKLENL